MTPRASGTALRTNRWRSLARRLAAGDPWLVLSAGPLLVFPGWWTIAGVGLIAAGWLGRWAATGRPSVATALDAPAALLALTTGIGVAVSPVPAVSAGRAWGILLGVAVYYALVNSTTRVRETALRGVTLIGVIVCVVGLLGTDWAIAPALTLGALGGVYERLPTLAGQLPGRDAATALDLFNPREVGGALALVLPVTAIRLWRGWRGWRRSPASAAGAAIATGVMGGVLLLSQSASAVGGVLLALWLSVAIADRARRRWWLAGGLLLWAVGLALAWPRLGGLTLLRDSTAMPTQPAPGVEHAAFGIAARLELWPRALQMVRDTPYTGAGPGTFPWVMDRFYPGFILGPERHAHNFLLQVAVDLGLPGLVALVWLLAAFAAHLRATALRSPDGTIRAGGLALAAGLLAFLLFGTIDVMPLGSAPVLALWILLGAGMAWGRVTTTGRPAWRRQTLPAVMVVLLVLALLAPIAWSGPSLNAGRVLAYRSLLRAGGGASEAAALRVASTYLEHAAHQHPQDSGTWYLLGTLAAHQGEAEVALTALRRGVFADSDAALRRYALSEALFRPTRGADWPSLQRVYAQWRTRYPQRAEWYATGAIVACEGQGDRQGALTHLEQGRAAGAEPRGVLQAYHGWITGGDPCRITPGDSTGGTA